MAEKKKPEERPAPDTDRVREALDERDRQIEESEDSQEEADED
jgi:predicted  nucleic acid-binding Zn-ribbon protein